jgi:hypothetical protein
MSFSLDGTGQGPFGGAINTSAQNGPDLEEIQTDVCLASVSHMSNVGFILIATIGAGISFLIRRGKNTITLFAMACQQTTFSNCFSP